MTDDQTPVSETPVSETPVSETPVIESPTPPKTEPITYEPMPVTIVNDPSPISNYNVANYAATIVLMGTNRLSPRGKYKGIPEAYRYPVFQYIAFQYDTIDVEFAHMFGYINDAEFAQINAEREGGYFE